MQFGQGKLLFSIILALVCLLTVSVQGGEIETFYRCSKLASPPRIDGIVDAGEWAGTEQSSPLVMTNTDTAAPVQTHFCLGYDSKRLYFAIICEEKKPDAIVAKVKNRDGDVYSDDCIELALDSAHEHTGMIKFIVNCLGTVADYRYGFTEWDANAEIAASRSASGWSVEISVPFSELDRDPPKAGEVWGLNVFRARYTDGAQLLNWVNAYGVFTIPSRLGHLVFDGPGVRLPNMVEAHPNIRFELEPELAKHGSSFEGKPWSAEDNELAQDHSMRTSTVTPHIQMAGPYGKKPVRALAFVRVKGTGRDANPGTKARDLIELAERFDIEPTAVFVNDQGICGGKLGERRLRSLLRDQYDVFIFANCPPVSIPKDQLDEITRRINDGAGVLCVGEGRGWLTANSQDEAVPPEFEHSLPIKELNSFQRMNQKSISGLTTGANPLIACYKVGKGRGALMTFDGEIQALTPFLQLTDESWNEFEYWIGIAGVVTSWCAGRDPQVTLNFSGGTEILRADLPKAYPIVIQPKVGVPIPEITLSTYIRNDRGDRTRLADTKISLNGAQPTETAIKMPVLAYGTYDLEVQAWQGKSVVGFAATRFSIIGPIRIDSFDVDKDYVEAGDTISGRFELVNPDRLQKAASRVELVTRDGRVLARQDYPGADIEKRQFSFVINSDTTIDMRIKISVLDKCGVVCSRSKPFRVPNRRRDQFNGVMWDAPDDPLGYYAYDNMRRVGFNASLNGIGTPVNDWTDFSAVPYATRLTNSRENGITNKACWNDEDALGKLIFDVVKRQDDNWKRGVFVYSLGDENDTLGCCLHPACLAAYRRYLAEQYKTIDALNASWGESYKSFDDIQLLEGDDFFKDATAYRTGKCARWFDRYRFAQVSYATTCGKFAEAFRELDPKAVTGFEGAGGFGDDVEAILDNVGMWSTYNNVLDDVLRTVAPPDLIRGNWMGYTKDADSLIAFMWRSVCLGGNSLWWWRWDGIGQYRGFVSPTLDLWPATKALSEETKVLRDGLGQLLKTASLENDGVAILYSVESAVADQLPSEWHFGRGNVAHSAFIHMLKDSGIQYRYVTPRKIAAGGLNRFRVLILPHCVSLAPETSAAIRLFVEKGGVVIADIRPGIMDNHVRMLPQGSLDEVFGVKRSGTGRAVALELPLKARVGDSSFSISWLRANADGDCSLSDGVSGAEVNGVPLFISNKFGRGRTLLLNFNLECFEGARDRTVATEIRAPIIAACEQAGVRPPVTLNLASGAPSTMTELTRWRVLGGQIISLRTDRFGWGWGDVGPGPKEKKQSTEVTLRQPAFVYDLRNHKCLGQVSKFRVDLKTGYANFYGIFTEQLPEPVLMCSTRAYQGAKELYAAVNWRGPETAVLFELSDPSGARPLWARKVVSARDGACTASWQLPLNQPGRWKVEARELFTGRSVRAWISN